MFWFRQEQVQWLSPQIPPDAAGDEVRVTRVDSFMEDVEARKTIEVE